MVEVLALEPVISEKATSIRKATIDALMGKSVEQSRVVVKSTKKGQVKTCGKIELSCAFTSAVPSFSERRRPLIRSAYNEMTKAVI